MSNPIRTERRGPVLEVTIDPKANAIDAPTSRIMGEIFAGFRDDPELRVAILTGAGEKFFARAGISRPLPPASRPMPTTASAALADCRSSRG